MFCFLSSSDVSSRSQRKIPPKGIGDAAASLCGDFSYRDGENTAQICLKALTRLRKSGEYQTEYRHCPRMALHLRSALMQAHDRTHDGQAQAGAAL